MADEFLSQEEIDALLGNGPPPAAAPPEGGSAAESAAGSGGADSSRSGSSSSSGRVSASDEAKPYDLAKEERGFRGRMPSLELIHERFARDLRVAMFGFIRKNPDVTTQDIKVMPWRQLVNSLVVPTSINFLQMSPLHGTAMIIIEPRLVFSLVEIMFGGNGRNQAYIEGREFSNTEQRIISRTLSLITQEYCKAWRPFHPMELRFQRSEMQPHFSGASSAREQVVSARFNIDIGDQGGTIVVCLPFASLEPILQRLVSPPNANPPEVDEMWARTLQQEIRPANVTLRAELAHTHLTIGRILDLQVGDVIELELDQQAQVKTGELLVFEGGYGTSDGHYAVRVDHLHSLHQLRED